MRKNQILILVFGLFILLLSSCIPTPEVNGDQAPTILPATATPMPPTQTPAPLTLEQAADQVITALANRDMETVAEFVHPEMGVRLSPYTYVEEGHLVFMPEELTALVDLDTVYNWGRYDGTGDPINLTFDEYYEEFIYSADFANPEQMAVDEEIGWSNTINNIYEFFPGSSYVEYHFSGFEEEFGGMDWESLRLVFVQDDGTWMLVGIVHDQWTI
jgi:hypothetical protein